MSDNFIIRQALPEDAPEIHRLVRELAEYEEAPQEVWTTPEDYKSYLEQGLFECHLALRYNQVLGMVLFYPTFSTWKGPMLHLEDFIVTASERRNGIGEKLFRHFLEIGKERGAVLLKWEVLDWNTPAIEFYKKYDVIFDKEWWQVKLILKEN